MKRVRELLARLTLTRQESLALVAVFGLYMVGLGWRHIQKTSLPPPAEFLAHVDSVAGSGALIPVAVPVGVVSDTVPKPKRVDGDSLGAPDPMDTGRLNVNLATKRQLTLLPGIGPALAQRIIDFRDSNGPFAGPPDLLKVKGIGAKTLARFEGMIVFE